MIEVGIWGIHWIVDVLQATDVKEGIIGPMITDWHIMTEVDTLHHLSTTAGCFCKVLCFISQLSGWNACFWMHKYSSCRTFCLLNWQTNWTWTWWVGFLVILYYLQWQAQQQNTLVNGSGGTSRNTQMQQSPISVMSQDQLMVQRMLLLTKLMTRLGRGVSPPILKRFLRSRSAVLLQDLAFFSCMVMIQQITNCVY